MKKMDFPDAAQKLCGNPRSQELPRTAHRTKTEVASLFHESIRSMTRDELLDVIVAGRLPLLSESQLSRLEFADRSTLERLAHLARRACRLQGY